MIHTHVDHFDPRVDHKDPHVDQEKDPHVDHKDPHVDQNDPDEIFFYSVGRKLLASDWHALWGILITAYSGLPKPRNLTLEFSILGQVIPMLLNK